MNNNEIIYRVYLSIDAYYTGLLVENTEIDNDFAALQLSYDDGPFKAGHTLLINPAKILYITKEPKK